MTFDKKNVLHDRRDLSIGSFNLSHANNQHNFGRSCLQQSLIMAPPAPSQVCLRDGNKDELHPARLLRYEGSMAVIQWETTGGILTVDPSRILQELPSRRRKPRQDSLTTPFKKIKKKRDVEPTIMSSEAANTPVAALPPRVSSSSSVAQNVAITPDSSVTGDSNAPDTVKSETEYTTIVRVKKEEVDNVYSGVEPKMSAECKARQEKMKAALTDPSTNGPRALFRRGCHELCVTTVLGGMGTDPCPLVMNVPELEGDRDNPFIKGGESYIAGHCDWNPWAPRFPGDNGMVDANFVHNKQNSYHMFTSCAHQKNNPLYHGEDAKGKYLYLRKYSLPKKKSDDDIMQGLRFQDLAPRLQLFRAKYFHRKKCTLRWTDPATGAEREVSAEDITEDHYNKALEEYHGEIDAEAEAKWEHMSAAKRARNGSLAEYKMKARKAADPGWQKQEPVLAWVQMLLEKQYVIDLVPVKFESYDEELYQELIAIGASNGEVEPGANLV